MASTTARCLLDGSRSASPPAVGGPCATSTGFARFSTSPSRSARSTNKQWQRKYEIGRARGPWDRPTRQGRVDNFSRRVLPLIRVSSSLRSDEAPLAVSIFGVCQRLPLLTGVGVEKGMSERNVVLVVSTPVVRIASPVRLQLCCSQRRFCSLAEEADQSLDVLRSRCHEELLANKF